MTKDLFLAFDKINRLLALLDFLPKLVLAGGEYSKTIPYSCRVEKKSIVSPRIYMSILREKYATI